MSEYLSTLDLLNRFKGKGMIIDDEDSYRQLKNIGYYKIKEYAEPFMDDRKYEGLLFSTVIRRYYYDKKLRIHLLDSIELIELTFKNSVANELGKNGAFRYLNFFDWADTNKFTCDYIMNKQIFIKQQLIKMSSQSNKKEYKRSGNFVTIDNKYQGDTGHGSEYPNVWMGVELLSFGQVYRMFEIMPIAKKIEVANEFVCSWKMLESWIGTIVLTRNLCAHNNNLVDVKLKTVPKVRYNWPSILVNVEGKDGRSLYSNRVAAIILPIVDLTHKIDPGYDFQNLTTDLLDITKKVRQDGQELTRMIGFQSKEKMLDFLMAHGNNH